MASPSRLMGGDPDTSLPALPQVGLQVLPTRTIYNFANSDVHVTLTFMTPALPEDLDVYSRPVTYLTWDVTSADGQPHEAALFFAASAALAVNTVEQQVDWSRPEIAGLDVLRVGTEEQSVLRRKGDDVRIDWGYAYVAAPKGDGQAAIGPNGSLTASFTQTGKLPTTDDDRHPPRRQRRQPSARLRV